MYVIALDNIKTTLKTRDKKTISVFSTTTNALNSFVWAVYGILDKDNFLVIPNIACLISASI